MAGIGVRDAVDDSRDGAARARRHRDGSGARLRVAPVHGVGVGNTRSRRRVKALDTRAAIGIAQPIAIDGSCLEALAAGHIENRAGVDGRAGLNGDHAAAAAAAEAVTARLVKRREQARVAAASKELCGGIDRDASAMQQDAAAGPAAAAASHAEGEHAVAAVGVDRARDADAVKGGQLNAAASAAAFRRKAGELGIGRSAAAAAANAACQCSVGSASPRGLEGRPNVAHAAIAAKGAAAAAKLAAGGHHASIGFGRAWRACSGKAILAAGEGAAIAAARASLPLIDAVATGNEPRAHIDRAVDVQAPLGQQRQGATARGHHRHSGIDLDGIKGKHRDVVVTAASIRGRRRSDKQRAADGQSIGIDFNDRTHGVERSAQRGEGVRIKPHGAATPANGVGETEVQRRGDLVNALLNAINWRQRLDKIGRE